MRPAKFVIVLTPFLLAVFMAPFWHTHLGPVDDSTLASGKSAAAIHHAHCPEKAGTPTRDGDRHADLDHSSPGTRAFVLLADLSRASFSDIGTLIAVAPVPFHAPIAATERLAPGGAVALHDPPEPGFLTPRAPPLPHPI